MTRDVCRAHDGLTRRMLLRNALLAGSAATVTSMFGDVLTQSVYGASESTNVLVVLSLRGGADGLSLVVPHAEPEYYRQRPNTAVPKDSLIFADETFGLHPSFAPLASLWASGQMAVMHAVGMLAPNYSHFSAMEQMEEAESGSETRVGWLNRMIGCFSGSNLLDGVAMGDTALPTSLVGPRPAVAVTDFSDVSFPYPGNASLSARQKVAIDRMYRREPGILGQAGRQAPTLAGLASPVARAEAAGPANSARYPQSSDLADALKSTAALIRTQPAVRAVAVDFGGWDHHVELLGRIKLQVDELAKCLSAFFVDLGQDSTRVTLITLSEFGRRLDQNGAAGVDHGYGNAVFLLGAGVNGGKYYGSWPGLGSQATPENELSVTTNYQHLISEILIRRFPDVDIAQVFPDLANPGSEASGIVNSS